MDVDTRAYFFSDGGGTLLCRFFSTVFRLSALLAIMVFGCVVVCLAAMLGRWVLCSVRSALACSS